MLAWLWTRLSEGGARASISGRALCRFPASEVGRLLRARVLIEQRKADSWSVCAQCDCGLDARPVEPFGDAFRACCPHDAAEDLVLDEQDLKRFSIEPERLAAKIAASGGLTGGVAPIVEGIWSIGATSSGIAVVLCGGPHLLDAPGTVLAIKAVVGGEAAVLIAHDFGAPVVLRLKEVGLVTADLDEVLVSDDRGTDHLDPDRLADATHSVVTVAGAAPTPQARLRISRARRTLRLDGRDIVLSLTGFDAFPGRPRRSSLVRSCLPTRRSIPSPTGPATAT